MADKKVSNFDTATALSAAATDYIPCVIGSATKKISWTNAIKAMANNNTSVAASGSASDDKLVSEQGIREMGEAYTNSPITTVNYEGCPSRLILHWWPGKTSAELLPAANSSTDAEQDPDFEIAGTDAASGTVALSAEGGLTCTTHTDDGDQIILQPMQDSDMSLWNEISWGTDNEVRWQCLIYTGAAITDSIIWAGLKLTSTSVTATDANQAFFRFAPGTNSGKWEAISSIGGSDDEADSGVTVAVSTAYHLMISISSARLASFYINGSLVETSAALTDATDLIPFIGVETDTGAKTITVCHQCISRAYGA